MAPIDVASSLGNGTVSKSESASWRIALVLEYQGSNYQGFQAQRDTPTVQGEMDQALEALMGGPIKTWGASRTDSGAHALGQVMAFTTQVPYPADVIARALNARLPADIRVQGAYEVEPGFDPRRHASSRRYQYHFLERDKHSALWRHFAYQVRGPLNVEAMGRAAACLVGRRDLSAFSSSPWTCTGPEVLQAEIQRQDDLVILAIEAQAFRPHQVRRTAGTLLRVGRGELTVEEFEQLVERGTPGSAGPTLPAWGLFLIRVTYPNFSPESLTRTEQETWSL